MSTMTLLDAQRPVEDLVKWVKFGGKIFGLFSVHFFFKNKGDTSFEG